LGQGKAGVWARKPALLELLGPDERLARRDPRVVPAGLLNLGATCYLNSIFQALFMLLPLRAGVLLWSPPPAGVSTAGGSTEEDKKDMKELQIMFACMQGSTRRSYSPRAFTQTFHLDPGVQQDVEVCWAGLDDAGRERLPC